MLSRATYNKYIYLVQKTIFLSGGQCCGQSLPSLGLYSVKIFEKYQAANANLLSLATLPPQFIMDPPLGNRQDSL
jgi:hypothetical protein